MIKFLFTLCDKLERIMLIKFIAVFVLSLICIVVHFQFLKLLLAIVLVSLEITTAACFIVSMICIFKYLNDQVDSILKNYGEVLKNNNI